MDSNGFHAALYLQIIIRSSPSPEVCRSPACSRRQTSTHSPTASSALTNICLSESRVPQNPMVDYSDYMNVSFFPFKQLWNLRNLHILGIPHFETKPDGHPSATRLDVLHVDVFTAARGQHLEGEDLLVDLIICDQLAVNDATLHVLNIQWFRTRQMVKKTHLSLKKHKNQYFSWDRLRHTVAAKSTVSCRSWAKVSFTTFDPCWQPGNNATNSNIGCNLATICYNIALILQLSNSCAMQSCVSWPEWHLDISPSCSRNCGCRSARASWKSIPQIWSIEVHRPWWWRKAKLVGGLNPSEKY